MTCCELFNKELKESKYVEYSDLHNKYYSKFIGSASKVMKEYEFINTIEGVAIPEIFYNKKTKTICVLCTGEPSEMDLLEDYLRSRPQKS